MGVDTQAAIKLASKHLAGLQGHKLDLLTIAAPVSPAAAVNLAKVVSKLSPLLGNLIEFNTVEFLNLQTDFTSLGRWKRQDPGFPDAIFEGSIKPAPGFEIKAWFPLATEITARFKDSQRHFEHDQTHVVLLAWLPEHLIFGTPYVVDVCIVSGLSVAKARDEHYHNPPDYLVVEPNDTSSRTQNLQQTNTNGYKWQGTAKDFDAAKKLVASWGTSGTSYSPKPDYQAHVRELMSKYEYRLDTNFAKIDRIVHAGIEGFKTKVHDSVVHGRSVKEWARLLASDNDAEVEKALKAKLPLDWGKKLVK